MTFNEANVNRDTSGKFDNKVGSAPDIALDSIVVSLDDIEDMDWGDSISTNADGIDEHALGDIKVERIDDDMYGVETRREVENDDEDYFRFLEDEYQATRERIPQSNLFTNDSVVLHAAIPGDDELTRADLRLAIADGEPGRYDRDLADGTLDAKYKKWRIVNTTSPAEDAIAKHAEVYWKGTDSLTPDGTYLITAREDYNGNGILYGYVMDEKERTILGRVETQYASHTNIGRSELYAGSGVKGGHWMRAEDTPEGTRAWNQRIVDQHKAMTDATIAEWTRAAENARGETMSPLEHVLNRENGINIMLRKKLQKAYNSPTGRTDVPALLRANQEQVTPGMYHALLRLSEDPAQ